MTTWRLELRPRAPWATPLRADSLFGAVCWCWLELFPENFEEMLAGFSQSGDPPFILSDAFPGESLPLPLHIAPPPTDRKLKPPIYISQSSFQEVVAAGIQPSADDIKDKTIGVGSRIRTALDRDLGSAAEGQLFEIATQHLRGPFDALSVYVRSDRYLKQVIACFRALALTGFGKKSSTGLGAFDVVDMPQSCEWLDDVPGANAFMALSHFVPAPTDPTSGRWRIHVTYPKFHANAVSNVFKGSILMIAPGSVFHTDAGAPRRWYGSMIPMPRPEMARAVHYALAFAAPLRWEERE